MFSGVRANSRMRLPILLLIALLFSSYGFAQQKGKPKPKPDESTAAAGDPAAGAASLGEQTAASSTAGAQEEAAAQVPAEKTPGAPSQRNAGTRTRSANNASKPEPAATLAPTAQPSTDAEAAAVLVASEPRIPFVPPSDPAVPAPTTAAAASQQESATPTQGSAWLDVVKTAGSIGLVLCLILGGYMMFRKFAPQYVAKRPGDRTLRMIESISMGDKRSIAIVQAGNKKLLVASTPGQITLLTVLSEVAAVPVPVHGAAEPTEAEAASGAKFRNLYEMEKKNVPSRPAARAELPPDIRGKMQQLRKALEG